MAISGILPSRPRTDVVFIGGFPSGADEKAFSIHGFSVKTCSEAEFNNQIDLSRITAVVITQYASSLSTFSALLKEHAKRLLDFDCRIIIRPADISDEKGQGQARADILKDLAEWRLPTVGLTIEEAKKFKHLEPTPSDQRSPFVRILHRASKWKAVAKEVIADPASHAPRAKLNFDGASPKPGSSDELLLKRAFWDCSCVHLKPLPGGRSGDDVYVYRAYPDLEAPVQGKVSPSLPYIVKIGPRKDIQTEYFKYVLSVKQGISFHLAPHLDVDRCCLGADRGILVGSFVEESETLLDRARSDRSGPAIISGLFNRTLAGWHRARAKDAEPESSIADHLLLFLKGFPEEPPKTRLALAKKLGAALEHHELNELFRRCKSKPVWLAPIHGDLHAKNVLVRNADAVVIDFFKHDRGPVLYDFACLEAGLLVDGFESKKGDAQNNSDWLDSILPLYDNPLFDATPHCAPKDPSYWYFSCIRQIRLHAHHMELAENQYAAALAIALLKKAAKDLDFREFERCRAAAYVLAGRVLSNAVGTTSHYS